MTVDKKIKATRSKTRSKRLKTRAKRLKTRAKRLKTRSKRLKTSSKRLKTRPKRHKTRSKRLKTRPKRHKTSAKRSKTNIQRGGSLEGLFKPIHESYSSRFDGLNDLNEIKSQSGPFIHINSIKLVGSRNLVSAMFNQNALSFYNLCTTTTGMGTSDAAEGHCTESTMTLYIVEKDYVKMDSPTLKKELARYKLSNDAVDSIYNDLVTLKEAVAAADELLIVNLRTQLNNKLIDKHGTPLDDRITKIADSIIASIKSIMNYTVEYDKPYDERSVLDKLVSITGKAKVALDYKRISDLLTERDKHETAKQTYIQTINGKYVPPRYLIFYDGAVGHLDPIRGIIPLRNIIPLHKLTISALGAPSAPIGSSLGKTLWNRISSTGNIWWDPKTIKGTYALQSMDDYKDSNTSYIALAEGILKAYSAYTWPPADSDPPQLNTSKINFAKAVSILILWKTRGRSSGTALTGPPLNKRVRYHYAKPPTDPFRFIKDAFYFSYYTTPLPTRDGTDISAYEHKPDEHKPDDYTNPNITTCRVSCVGGDDFYDSLMQLALDDYNRRPMLEPEAPEEPAYTTICDYLYGGPSPGTADYPSGYQYDKVPLNLTGQFNVENIKEQVIAAHKAYMEQTLDNVIICQKNKDSGSADAAEPCSPTTIMSTKGQTFDDQGPLPPGWKTRMDPVKNRRCYYNRGTKQTQWIRPYNDFTRVLCDTFIPSKFSPTSEGRTREYISLYLLAYWYGLNPFTLNPITPTSTEADASAKAIAISETYYSDNYKIGDDKHLNAVKDTIINSSWFTDIKDYKIYITMTDGEGKHYMITDGVADGVADGAADGVEWVVKEMDVIDPTVMFTDYQLHTYWMEGNETAEANVLSDILNKPIEISHVHYKINYIKMKPCTERYPLYFDQYMTETDQCFRLDRIIQRQNNVNHQTNQMFLYETVYPIEAQLFYRSKLDEALEEEWDAADEADKKARVRMAEIVEVMKKLEEEEAGLEGAGGATAIEVIAKYRTDLEEEEAGLEGAGGATAIEVIAKYRTDLEVEYDKHVKGLSRRKNIRDENRSAEKVLNLEKGEKARLSMREAKNVMVAQKQQDALAAAGIDTAADGQEASMVLVLRGPTGITSKVMDGLVIGRGKMGLPNDQGISRSLLNIGLGQDDAWVVQRTGNHTVFHLRDSTQKEVGQEHGVAIHAGDSLVLVPKLGPTYQIDVVAMTAEAAATAASEAR
jgi:hypothetical protein